MESTHIFAQLRVCVYVCAQACIKYCWPEIVRNNNKCSNYTYCVLVDKTTEFVCGMFFLIFSYFWSIEREGINWNGTTADAVTA